MNVKRDLFLVPWLFLAIGVAAVSDRTRYPRLEYAALLPWSWQAGSESFPESTINDESI